MANKDWKGVYPLVFVRSRQPLISKFIDPSTSPMRKGCDGEKKKWKRIVKIAVHYRCASQLPFRWPLVPKMYGTSRILGKAGGRHREVQRQEGEYGHSLVLQVSTFDLLFRRMIPLTSQRI